MIICKNCLMAIESHEGKQLKKELSYDDERLDDNGCYICEWCEEETPDSELVEIV